jgi:large subunit ribosomal protein L29
MKVSDLRALTVAELRAKENDYRRELFNLRFQNAKGELTNNMRIRAVKKDIARILTVITEKEKAPTRLGNK